MATYKLNYTGAEINALLGKVENLEGFNFEIISEFPTTNISTSTIYLLPKENGENNIYEEYLHANNQWELIGTTEINLTDYATKEFVNEKLNEKETTFHLFYNSEDNNEDTLTTKLLPTLNTMYQEYLAGKKPILVFVSDATFGMSAETGMYMINAEDTTASIVMFEQLNSSIAWAPGESFTEFSNKCYRIRGHLTDGEILSADWRSTGFSDGGAGYIATETYYETPFIPTEDYHPATKKYVDNKAQTVEIRIEQDYLDNYTAADVVEQFEKAFVLNSTDGVIETAQQTNDCYLVYDYMDYRLPLYRVMTSTWNEEETDVNFTGWYFIFRGIIDVYDTTISASVPTIKEITIQIKHDKSLFRYSVSDVALARQQAVNGYEPISSTDITTKGYVDAAIETAIADQLAATY